MSTASSQQPDIVCETMRALLTNRFRRPNSYERVVLVTSSQHSTHNNRKLSNEIFEIENSRNTSSEKQKNKIGYGKVEIIFFFFFFLLGLLLRFFRCSQPRRGKAGECR